MIVDHTNELIFIPIPRTASHSIASVMLKQFQGEQIFSHHSYRVDLLDFNIQYYTVFTVVRDPYSRCWSWYSYDKMKALKRKECFNWNFTTWLRNLNIQRNKINHNLKGATRLFANQSEYYRRSRANLCLRFENLEQEIKKIKIFENIELPKIYSSNFPVRTVYEFTEEQKRLILSYCNDDFYLFGYKK